MPTSLWSHFVSTLTQYANIKFSTQGHFYTYDCTPEKFPIIYLQVAGYWLEMNPEDYLLDATESGNHGSCMFAFTQNEDEFWLLGDVFYRGYYVVHDDVNAKLGIAPHSASRKKALTRDYVYPTQTLQE